MHGKRRVIETDNLKEYYLDGRCQTTFERDGVVLRLTVAATCDTYMIKKIPTIYNVTIDSAGTKSIVCKNSRKRVIPTITTDGEITITFNGNSYTLDAGTHRITNIVFTEGDNNITFSGAEGTKLSVEYREGAI
ncbi:hypothetical protein [Halolactibacillus miurensis]|uniref:hypothetical protein n=1 Tax=Halolactibacillus miurensis TaxID=306541 RepID=UPI00116059B1|nr:hypothetical protein [Halolactibacillus miurensis]